jgi:hypothetical protein
MSGLQFQSLSGQPLVGAGDVAFQLSVETPDGWRNIELGTLQDFLTGELAHRVEVIEDSILREAAPWPYARRLTLTGHATGFVDIDGTQDVSLAVTIPPGTLPQSVVDGLSTTLLNLRLDVDGTTVRVTSLESALATKLGKTETAVAAQKLATPRNINGVAFDGTQDINVGGDGHYTHNQVVASTQWNINHNLNKRPSVTVVDSAGTNVTGAVSYPDANNVRIDFVGAMSGQAFLN